MFHTKGWLSDKRWPHYKGTPSNLAPNLRKDGFDTSPYILSLQGTRSKILSGPGCPITIFLVWELNAPWGLLRWWFGWIKACIHWRGGARQRLALYYQLYVLAGTQTKGQPIGFMVATLCKIRPTTNIMWQSVTMLCNHVTLKYIRWKK